MLYTAQKKAMNNRHLNLKQNRRLFFIEKIEKKSPLRFSIPKIVIFCWSRLNFWKTCQDSKEMTLPTSSWDVYGQSQEFL